MRYLLKVDGTQVEYPEPVPILKVCEIIGATMLDTVSLKNGVDVMCVDDTGLIDGKPINEEATKLYRDKCGNHWMPGFCIHGDVFICPDEDYA